MYSNFTNVSRRVFYNYQVPKRLASRTPRDEPVFHLRAPFIYDAPRLMTSPELSWLAAHVLRTAGKTKRDNLNENEEVLLMKTLRDTNLPKLVPQDAPLFLSLLDDLFPSSLVADISVDALAEVCMNVPVQNDTLLLGRVKARVLAAFEYAKNRPSVRKLNTHWAPYTRKSLCEKLWTVFSSHREKGLRAKPNLFAVPRYKQIL